MPIKRSKSLIPLSHDHHHGLTMVRNLRNGLKRQIDPDRMAAYVLDFWEGDLRGHFHREETIVFPLLPENDPGAQHALLEHRQVHALVAQMNERAEPKLLTAFSDLLEAHIRFEERVLFPQIEQRLSLVDLMMVGNLLHQQSMPAPVCWTDAFWKD